MPDVNALATAVRLAAKGQQRNPHTHARSVVEVPRFSTVKDSGEASTSFLDTCLDYSLTNYLMQRAASGVNFADPTQPNDHEGSGTRAVGDNVVSCARWSSSTFRTTFARAAHWRSRVGQHSRAPSMRISRAAPSTAMWWPRRISTSIPA